MTRHPTIPLTLLSFAEEELEKIVEYSASDGNVTLLVA